MQEFVLVIHPYFSTNFSFYINISDYIDNVTFNFENYTAETPNINIFTEKLKNK